MDRKIKTIGFFLLILTISCNRIDKVSEKEKNLLELQIDSLKQLNENLTTTRSFLFENALNLEDTDKETAISIYKTITDTKQGDFWAVESEKRILDLTKEEVIKKNTRFVLSEDFYWLFGDTLELSQQDTKCGEWGGDIERIRVFWKSRKLIGYYTKETFDCDSLKREYIYGRATPTIYKSKEIEITPQQTELLKETILNLTEHQLNNLDFFGNSGIVNTVQVKGKDRSFKRIFIQDYPSFYWNKFHKLKNGITK
jgi:hypothetical protein